MLIPYTSSFKLGFILAENRILPGQQEILSENILICSWKGWGAPTTVYIFLYDSLTVMLKLLGSILFTSYGLAWSAATQYQRPTG